MTIEDRVRRVLTDAVADEPPLHGAPLQVALRRRRRRPMLAGAVAVVLVLAAMIGVVAVRRPSRVVPAAPTLTTLPTTGWPEVTDDAGNLSFRHPPGWEARRGPTGVWTLAPRDVPRDDQGRPGFEVTVRPVRGYWKSDGYWRATTPEIGRLPGGQDYLFIFQAPTQQGSYAVDWGRVCGKVAAPGSCQPRSVQVQFRSATGRPSLDRYRAQVVTVVGTLRPLRGNAPTVGDRSRPACLPEQWALVHPDAWAGVAGRPLIVVPAGVRFRGGRPCHLQLAVSMAVHRDGRPLPVQGSPAPATIELDLPEDALPGGYRGIDDERILQLWLLDYACEQALDGTEFVFSDDRGKRLLGVDIGQSGSGPGGCPGQGGQPLLATWP
jgi:hypothetical protein